MTRCTDSAHVAALEMIAIREAERDAARTALADMLALITRVGGWMKPEDQQRLRDARAVLDALDAHTLPVRVAVEPELLRWQWARLSVVVVGTQGSVMDPDLAEAEVKCALRWASSSDEAMQAIADYARLQGCASVDLEHDHERSELRVVFRCPDSRAAVAGWSG